MARTPTVRGFALAALVLAGTLAAGPLAVPGAVAHAQHMDGGHYHVRRPVVQRCPHGSRTRGAGCVRGMTR
jgi:hypothetical protein